jgi:hypothetical protein
MLAIDDEKLPGDAIPVIPLPQHLTVALLSTTHTREELATSDITV